jgi:hypothetical protein
MIACIYKEFRSLSLQIPARIFITTQIWFLRLAAEPLLSSIKTLS